MPLDVSGVVTGQVIQAAHVYQYYNLLTGAMTDQAVALKNQVAVGGSHGTGVVPLVVNGASGQTADLLNVKNFGGSTMFGVSAAGAITFAGGVTVSGGGITVAGASTFQSGGVTVQAGGLVVTAGGLTVSAGSVSFPANSISGAALSLGQLTNSIGGNIALNVQANYFDGPAVAQGATGTWFAIGTVTVQDGNGAATFNVKLHDGSTTIASAQVDSSGVSKRATVTLSGYLANPAGNIRISVKDPTSTGGSIQANDSGNGKDSTLTVFRIA